MRLTTASMAAVLLLAAGIVTFWPGNNAGPGAAAVVAQVPAKSDPQGAADPFGAPAGTPAATRPGSTTMADKLNQRTDAEFVETALKDAITFLAERGQIQIIIKQKRLEEAGVNLDSPITLQLKNVRLSTLLDVMLEDLNLVYTEKDDLVVITTPDDAQATMEVRVYDCRDLLTMPTLSQARPGMMMPGMGHPPGSIGPPDLGPRNDSSLPSPSFPGGNPSGFPGDAPGPSLAPGIPGATPPTGRSGIPIEPFGGPSGAPIGGDPASGDPLAPPRRPRTDVLPQVLMQNAGGLGGPPSGMMGGMGGPMGGMGGAMGGGMGGMQPQQPQRPMTAEELKAEQLLNIITTAVNPDTWTEMGGPGTIGEYNGLVVVSQSARTHTKIEKVLDMLREAANLPRTPGPRVVR